MINIKENDNLNVLNHSCAHLLAHAVKRLYPHALFWVGPVIEEGFYYDIDLGDEVIRDEDLEKIAAKLEKSEIVPEFPGIVISNELWAQNRISDVSEKIGDFQTALQNAIWELQELCQ